MTEQHNPFADATADDGRDEALLRMIEGGDRDALEELVLRHQAWIFNLALRMVHRPEEAEDATQEILIKLITRLATFAGASSLRTWLYRIAINHLLNMKRGRAESRELSFAQYGQNLDDTPNEEFADQNAMSAEAQLLVAEARIGCTSGMLLCLDRGQRLVYILGDIFGVSDRIGAEILALSRSNFRQKLARARRDLNSFMQDKCGLVNTANPCRCARKTQGFIKTGHVDPGNLVFAREHVARVRDIAARTSDKISELDQAYAEIHRDHPFQKSPDFVAALKELMNRSTFRGTLELD